MRSASLTLPLAVAAVLLLTSCGPGTADGLTVREAGSPDLPGTSSCGPRSPGPSEDPSAPALPGDPLGLEKDGVRITGMGNGPQVCAEFDVTNHETVPFTYAITFAFVSESGEVLTHAKQTVPSVGPGRPVKGTVTMDRLSKNTYDRARVRITEVRSVPSAEAPSEGGACPPSGMRVYADEGNAAMGLRVVGLHLENCGTRPAQLNGFPQLQLLDRSHRPVTGVKIHRGGSAVSTGAGTDDAPQPVTLEPGERARSGLVWRNTVEAGAGDTVNAPYVRVRAKPGAAPVLVTPELDLGTTGELRVRPWTKDGTTGPAAGDTSGTRPSAPS